MAFPHAFNLIEWEAGNFLSKWVHRVATAMPWSSSSEAERLARVDEYVRLGSDLERLYALREKAAAEGGGDAKGAMDGLQREIEDVRAARAALRNDVEEVLEANISAVLSEDGFSSRGLIFPPVDIRLSEPPKLLVTSPRDRISRTHDVLLDADVSVEDSVAMEEALLEGSDLSALVVDIGGVATYPASVENTLSLQSTLRVAAHEWLHNYLFFRPLGFNIFDSPEMTTLNETLADIAGREIGDRAFEALGGESAPQPLPSTVEAPIRGPAEDEGRFDFNAEMRETRLRVDELLEAGDVDAAEAYMQERRRLFAENGFSIRKLNQAFFAFNGTYAESPASASPIGDQLHELRGLVPDLKTFIDTMSRLSTYAQFLEELDRLRETGGPVGLMESAVPGQTGSSM